MTLHALGFEPKQSLSRAETFANSHSFDRPTVILDLDQVSRNFAALKAGLGDAHIHYAVKANPERAIIERLASLGCHFDAASRGEIELCLSQGARPETISFGNTVKRPSDIAFAWEAGVRVFAADAEEELAKIALHAPGAQVYIRLLVNNSQADWPLSRKFGCDRAGALELLDTAVLMGLKPMGFSFHVGSQTRRADMWNSTLDEIAETWAAAKAEGHELTLLNIGGGFPAFYGEEIDAPEGIEQHWLIQSDPHEPSTAQEELIRALPWPEGRVQTCIAGESGVIKALRGFLHQEKALDRKDTYISGYWKIGLVEDEHQKMKRAEQS